MSLEIHPPGRRLFFCGGGGAGVKVFGKIYGVPGSLWRGGKCGGNILAFCGDGDWFFFSRGVLEVGIFKASVPALDLVGREGLIMSLSEHSLVVAPTYGVS